MRIVDRATFLSLPEGTIFAKYEPCVFDDLCIKYDTTRSNDDFWYVPLSGAIESKDSGDFVDKCKLALQSDVTMVFDEPYRDGDSTANNQLFAVWSEEDIEKLIKVLTKGRIKE